MWLVTHKLICSGHRHLLNSNWVLGFVLGASSVIFGRQLLRIYNTDPQVIEYGMIRLRMFGYAYFMCGVMEIFVAMMRGMGRSFVPMVVSLMGACVFRIIWIFTVFPKFHTSTSLYISYPISWSLVVLINGTALFFVCRKLILRGEDPRRLARKKPTAR